VLFITGDPPKMSPTYPRSTAVFDLDSVAMVRLTHSCLNAGVDFGGTPLGKQADPRTHFTIGTGFEPEAVDSKRELDRLRQKLDNGADYIMTQPAFRHEPLVALEKFRAQRPILVGVMVLTSLEQAQRLAQVPGVVLPDEILQRLATASTPADQAKIGRDIAAEQVRWVLREGWSGLYLMAPAGTGGVVNVLQAGLH
jgi:homocysteine S-methyltransferase